MYWSGAIGSSMVVFCSMGFAVSSLTGIGQPECELKVLSSGEEVITCNDGSVSRVESGTDESSSDRMDFRGRDLSGLDLRQFDLRGAIFDGAVLTNVQFQGVDLTGASFEGASLYEVDLREANLTAVRFQDATLTQSRLEGALWHDTICPSGVSSGANSDTCRGQLTAEQATEN